MFVKATIVYLMAICARGNFLNPHQPNYAISSQSFYRQDVPLSYNYSLLHVYNTPSAEKDYIKPKNQRSLNNNQAELDPVQYKNIQYAPVRIKGDKIIAGQQSKASIATNIVTTKEPIRKDHLEPLIVDSNNYKYENPKNKFIPGHNIEVLQSVRSPAHDNIYGNFPGSYEENKSKMINNLNKNIIYRQSEAQPQAVSNIHSQDELTVTNNPLIALPPNQHNGRFRDDFRYNNGIVATNQKLKAEYQPQHGKIHRLLLNVARVYNIAQVPKKAHDSIKSMNKVPTHSHSIIIPNVKSFAGSSQKKTYLYPVKYDNQQHNAHALSAHDLLYH